jgi:hypothetical protein
MLIAQGLAQIARHLLQVLESNQACVVNVKQLERLFDLGQWALRALQTLIALQQYQVDKSKRIRDRQRWTERERERMRGYHALGHHRHKLFKLYNTNTHTCAYKSLASM